MEYIYFWVTKFTDAWGDKYGFHANYFNGPLQSGSNWFFWGFLIILGVAAAVAAGFYFGLCNGRSNKNATLTNWLIALVATGVIAFCFSHFIVIGQGVDGKAGSGFYKANQQYCMDYCLQNKNNPQVVSDCRVELNKITNQLQKGNDVALPYDLTNVILSLLFFWIISIFIKGFSVHGASVPHHWPMK